MKFLTILSLGLLAMFAEAAENPVSGSNTLSGGFVDHGAASPASNVAGVIKSGRI